MRRHFRVDFERTGGFAGLRLSVTVDSQTLPAEEAFHLEENLANAQFFDLPAKMISSQGGADRYQYRITVQEQERIHTVELSESAVSEACQSLIRQLTLLARTAGTK